MANQTINAAFLDFNPGGPFAPVSGTTSGTAISVHGYAVRPAGFFADVVHLYATNTDAAVVELFIAVNADYTNVIRQEIPPRAGAILVLPGLMIALGVEIEAWASVADKILLFGQADRIGEQ